MKVKNEAGERTRLSQRVQDALKREIHEAQTKNKKARIDYQQLLEQSNMQAQMKDRQWHDTQKAL